MKIEMNVGKPKLKGSFSTPSFEGNLRQSVSVGGTTDYNNLENKPSINEVTLQGDLTLADLNLISGDEIAEIYVPKMSSSFTVSSYIDHANGAIELAVHERNTPKRGTRITQSKDSISLEYGNWNSGSFVKTSDLFTSTAGSKWTTSCDVEIRKDQAIEKYIEISSDQSGGDSYIQFVQPVSDSGRVYISGLTEPRNGNEAANKAYVDSKVLFFNDAGDEYPIIAQISPMSYPVSGIVLHFDDGSIDGKGVKIPDLEGFTAAANEIIGMIPTVPTDVSDFTNDAGYITAAEAPVQSVNGQTGAVNIAIPTVPTNVSAFTNDANYITASGAPVQSVNGQTGAVTLTIPTVPSNVSAFVNDAGYLTLATLPVYNGGVS